MGARVISLLLTVVVATVLTACPGGLTGVNWKIPGFSLPADSQVVKQKPISSYGQVVYVSSSLGYREFGDQMDRIMSGLGFTRDPKSMQPWEQGYSVTYWKESENQKLTFNYQPNPPEGKRPKNLYKNWEYNIILIADVDQLPDRSQ